MPEHELLSAYLDGELTAEEHAQVEQLLAGSPAARQALEEMRTLSSAIQSLPAQTVGEDLSQRVLRVAERRILAEPAEPEAEETEPEWTTVVRQSVGRQLRRPRTWFWPAVAVAAALLMFLRTPEIGEQPAKSRLAKAPAFARAPAEAPSIQANGRLADKPSKPEQTEALEREMAEDRAVAEPATESAAAPVAKKDSGVEERKLTLDAMKETAPPVLTSPAKPAAAPAPPGERVVGSPASAGSSGVVDRKPEPARRAAVVRDDQDKAKGSDAMQSGAVPLLVVACQITPEAAKERLLEKILAQGPLAERADAAAKKAEKAQNHGREAGVSYVEIDATRAELLTLLQQLKARPEAFVAVPEPSQLGLSDAAAGSAAPTSSTKQWAAGGGQRAGGRQEATKQLAEGEESQMLPSPHQAEFGAAGQDLQFRARSQARLQAAQGDALAITPSPTYRVRFELRVVSPDTVAAEASPSQKPPAAAAKAAAPSAEKP